MIVMVKGQNVFKKIGNFANEVFTYSLHFSKFPGTKFSLYLYPKVNSDFAWYRK